MKLELMLAQCKNEKDLLLFQPLSDDDALFGFFCMLGIYLSTKKLMCSYSGGPQHEVKEPVLYVYLADLTTAGIPLTLSWSTRTITSDSCIILVL